MIAHLTLAAALISVTRVDLADREVRADDVSAGGSGGATVIAQLPQGRSSLRMSGAAVARLLARAVPGAKILSPKGEYLFVVQQREQPAGKCWQALQDIAAGEAINTTNAGHSNCESHGDRTRFDVGANGTTRARVALAKGTKLGPLWLQPKAAVEAGQTVRLTSRVGPIKIERSVEVLQRGLSGGKVFVRDLMGHVFATTVGAEGVQ